MNYSTSISLVAALISVGCTAVKPSDTIKTVIVKPSPSAANSKNDNDARVNNAFPKLAAPDVKIKSAHLMRIVPRLETWTYHWTCKDVAWDKYCEVKEAIAFDQSNPGMQYCSHTEERLSFNPEPSSSIIDNVHLWSEGAVTINTDNTVRFNHLYVNARTEGGSFWNRTGGHFDFKIHVELVPASFSNEDRELFSCKPRYYLPSMGSPDRHHACACVFRSDPGNVQTCLTGGALCDRDKLTKQTTVLRCVADEAGCDDVLKGGVCPWDISPNFDKVSVASSPYCK